MDLWDNTLHNIATEEAPTKIDKRVNDFVYAFTAWPNNQNREGPIPEKKSTQSFRESREETHPSDYLWYGQFSSITPEIPTANLILCGCGSGSSVTTAQVEAIFQQVCSSWLKE